MYPLTIYKITKYNKLVKGQIDTICTLEKDHRLLNNKSYMLNKSDLNQIGNVVGGKLKLELEPIKKDIKYLKKKVNRIDRTASLIVKNYDAADVNLEKRVRKINSI